MRKYYLKNGSRVTGPYLLDDLKYQKINQNTQVKVDESGEWVPVSQDPDLSFLIRIQSDYSYTGHNETNHEAPVNNPNKSRVFILAAVILIISIGMAIALFLKAEPGI